MTSSKSIHLVLLSLLLLVDAGEAFAWGTKTHLEMTRQNISQRSEELSALLGVPVNAQPFIGSAAWGWEFAYDNSLTAKQWIENGSEWEDEMFTIALLTHNMRSVNHYYNPFWDHAALYPYASLALSQQGGLYDVLQLYVSIPFWIYPYAINSTWKGKPLPAWAYDGSRETPPMSDFTSSSDNFFSWKNARKYYYAALTGDSTALSGMEVAIVEPKTEMNEAERDRCFAVLFRSIGHMMHLVQDAGIPEHTRNDAHPLSSVFGFESYASSWNVDHPAYAPALPIPWNRIVKSDEGLLDFFDSDRSGGGYTPTSTGLAEYSNYHFFTKDTIPENLRPCSGCAPAGSDRLRYFTHPVIDPNRVSIEPGKVFNVLYFMSEPIVDPLGVDLTSSVHLARPGWYNSTLAPYGWGDYTTEDMTIWAEYIVKLISKTSGYSGTAMDYFFRGHIDIKPPENGVYAVYDPQKEPNAQSFAKITLRARNVTDYDEEMSGGTVMLIIKYKEAQQDPFVPGYIPLDNEFSYMVLPAEGVTSLPRGDYQELEFDLDPPLPLRATCLYLYLVFKGRLGQEDGAVAVGFKDVSEPTPFDIFNVMDKVCVNSAWVDSGSPAVLDGDVNINGKPDGKEADLHPHRVGNLKLRFSPTDEPVQFPPPDDVVIESIEPGTSARIYVISDDEYNIGLSEADLVRINPNDDYSHDAQFLRGRAAHLTTITRQNDWMAGDFCTAHGVPSPCMVGWYPPFEKFREQNVWNYTYYKFWPFPLESSRCSIDDLPKPN